MNETGTPENLKPFKPGESGNPDGRPKGSRNRSTIVREMLSKVADLQEIDPKNADTLKKHGIETKAELESLITAAQILKAMGGDTKAYQALMDSGYGQPKQKSEIEITGIDPIIPGEEDAPTG